MFPVAYAVTHEKPKVRGCKAGPGRRRGQTRVPAPRAHWLLSFRNGSDGALSQPLRIPEHLMSCQ